MIGILANQARGYLLVVVFYPLFLTFIHGQNDTIQTTISTDAEYLIREVFLGGGDCFEVFNIELSGAAGQAGFFTGGNSSVGFEEGIVLSNGNVEDIAAPNEGYGLNDGTTTTYGVSGSDPDLETLAGIDDIVGDISDVVVLEFDFTPTLDSISFEFVFASEEYCEFVLTQFVDIFGFFISGPGLNGPYTDGGINMALTPDGAESITARSINAFFRPEFYINNIPPGESPCSFDAPALAPDIFSFDGLTVPLTASAAVIPCETYHLRLVMCDVVDELLDAAVFLKANSFAVGRTARLSGGVGTLSPIPIEGCSNTNIIFSRGDSVMTNDLIIKYDILPSSTATAGVDYTGLPDSLIIPAGVFSDTIDITLISDNIIEGVEFFTIKLQNPCDCSQSELTIFIEEPPYLDGTITGPDTICNGNGVSLMVNPIGGVGPFEYLWSNGDTDSLFNDAPINDQTYQVIVSDICGQMDTLTQTVEVQYPSGFIDGSGTLCDGLPEVSFPIVLTGGSSFTFDLIEGTTTTTTYTAIEADTIWIPTSETAIFELNNLSADGCPGTTSGSAAVLTVEINTEAQIDSLDCFADQDAIIELTPDGGDGQYTYQWAHDSTINGPQANNLGPGNYPVFINDNQGCLDTILVNITEPSLLEISVDSLQPIANCLTGGSLEGNAMGGTAPYTYSWSNGASTNAINDLSAGNYTLNVEDAQGCISNFETTILADSILPNITLQALDSLDCLVSEVILDASLSDQGDEFSYTWTNSNNDILSPSDSLSLSVNDQQAYTLSITNNNNGCSNEASIAAINITNTPVFTIESEGMLDCGNSSVNLFVPDSLANWQAEWQDINGMVLATNSWTFSATTAGTYQVVVMDLNTNCSSSNDFILNSIPTFPSLTLVETVDTLGCSNGPVGISINTSGGSGSYSYEWEGPAGGIVSDPLQEDISVASPGDYTLIVTDQDGSCTDTLSVGVFQDIDAPELALLMDTSLTCNLTTIELIASSLDANDEVSFEWFDDANGASLSTESTVTINTPGTYSVLLTDTDNGCTDDLVVNVNDDTSPPQIEISALTDTLDCITDLVAVDASVLSGSGNYAFQWTGPAGGINGNDQAEDLTVGLAGAYTLITNDLGNGCADTSTVNIESDINFPVAELASPVDSLDCQTDMLTIDTEVTVGSGNYTFQWTGPLGGIIGDPEQEDITINTEGNYSLIVNDITNGCTDTLETTVFLDDTSPVLNLLPNDTTLNCIVGNIEITAGSNSDGILAYEWFDESGNTIGQSNNINLTTIGNYSVSLTNTENGCTDETTINVLSDTTPPVVQLTAMPDTLDCFTTEVLLHPEVINGSGDYNYQWTGPAGGINGDGTSANIDAFEPGDYSLTITDNANGCNDTLDVMIFEALGTLSLNPLPDSTLTCTVNEITYTAQSPDMGNLVYEWFDEDDISIQAGATISLTTAGSYTIQVTDLNNDCSQSSIVNITLDTISPIISPAPFSNLSCEFTELTLSAAIGPETYTPNWLDENGDQLNTNSWSQAIQQAGSYTLEVTDNSNGCLSFAEYVVTADTIAPTASISVPDQITCITDTVTISANINSGSGNYSYEWSGPNMGISGPVDQVQTTAVLEGNYQLTITDISNGCIAELSTMVDLDNTPPELVTINDTTLNCFHPAITLEASSLSTGMLNFSWEDENGMLITNTPTIQIDEAGQYIINVVDANNGCDAQRIITVSEELTPPIANAGEDVFLGCDQDDITLEGIIGNTNWQPSWIDQNGNIVSTNSWSYTTSEAGSYQLLVVDLDNGCEAADFATINLDQSFPIADAGDDIVFDCFMNEAFINAGNSSQGDHFSYQLYTTNGTLLAQSNTPSFSVDQAGNYQLIVVNEENNCESSDEVTVLSDFPLITNVLTNNIPCDGENENSGSIILEAVVSGTPPYLYSIDGGNSFQIDNAFLTLTSGNYELVVQDANGCEAQESTSIIQESGVDVSLPETINATWGESIALEPIINQDTSTLFSFSWDASPQLDCDKCLDNEFLASESEVLAFRVVDDRGCSAEAIVSIIVDQRIPIYIPNAFSPDNDGFNDRFTIFGDPGRVIDIAQFLVYDRWGNIVFSKKDLPLNDPTSGWDGTFNGKTLGSNVFVYQIEVRLQNGETTILTGDILLAK